MAHYIGSARKRAIKICKMLAITINKMTTNILIFDNKAFDSPRARKSALKRLKNNLMKRHEIKEEEL
jgi:hypothetical protein